jgi:hypothetical protein
MTRVEGENTRLRHYLARLHRKTLCYSSFINSLSKVSRGTYSLRINILIQQRRVGSEAEGISIHSGIGCMVSR